ncbi:MAG: hypothetical protein GFH27_549321n64 [Chloroflexi bacterium AL-W]|nr:hypothetical protein [Chloroflexi bacterium AL-N1]NOK64942.1 hypothetical protein [Chloroflexi bacterium AL-N10]NOK76712.1 hypothetical protein [Chloroflexi bacterium AL-N5]NOK84603.1 hypothetical protein [Chloroflexi bacterium AL-W]NOK86572.1 hypothetical protein [Chloroflexi bacterium AL-N15]
MQYKRTIVFLSVGLAACGAPTAEQALQATHTPTLPTSTPEPATEAEPELHLCVGCVVLAKSRLPRVPNWSSPSSVPSKR